MVIGPTQSDTFPVPQESRTYTSQVVLGLKPLIDPEAEDMATKDPVPGVKPAEP